MAITSKRPSEGKPTNTLQKLVQESPTVRLSIEIDREMHKKLKILAAEGYTTISDVVRKMVDDRLKGA
jgi:hypothetical protein